jgi:phage terminase large subunit-like protein
MSELSARDRDELRELLAEQERRFGYKFNHWFPDEGVYRRELYPKHIAFFEDGASFKERLFMAANRVGKSDSGAFEVTCHLTGLYPHWWTGRRFDHPTDWWVCGTTSETLRDIVQVKLFGQWQPEAPVGPGGMVPGHLVIHHSKRPHGLPGSLETVWVRHVSGGTSTVGLKMYEQGRKSFEGTAKHGVWCIAEGELVQMADGRLLPIEQVCVGDQVLSLDEQGRVVQRRVLRTLDQGIKPCIRVYPVTGPPIVCTPDHQLYFGYGRDEKVPAAVATTVVQAPMGWWPEATEDRDEAWYVWAALVVAEGYVAGRKVTHGHEQRMAHATALLPDEARVRRKEMPGTHVPDWHLVWPAFWETWGPSPRRAPTDTHRSHHMAIPAWVCRSSRDKVALFLRWLYAGDGWASTGQIGYATTSPRLANQLACLLHRFGVRASVTCRRPARVTWRAQWWVRITAAADVLRFLDVIGLEGKDEAMARVRVEAERRLASTRGRPPRPNGRITHSEPVGERRVYDLTVEHEHRFLVGISQLSNCDEEPPEDCYTEMLYRTVTTKGIMLVTFTPLQGMSSVVMGFLEPDNPKAREYKAVTNAGWDDVPHLDPAEKAVLLATTPPFQRDARTKGLPQLGAGAIYQMAESDIKVKPFTLPSHWPRVFGLDAGGGAKPTAVAWGTLDRDSQTLYIYDVYRRETPEIAIHTEAIKARGAWIPGVGDAAALITTMHDAEQIISAYRRSGLDLTLPDKSVEAGIQAVWLLLSAGRFKVFETCEAWFKEYRLYHRNEKGQIVKANDHLLDATRYLVHSGLRRAKTELEAKNQVVDDEPRQRPLFAALDKVDAAGWMGS